MTRRTHPRSGGEIKATAVGHHPVCNLVMGLHGPVVVRVSPKRKHLVAGISAWEIWKYDWKTVALLGKRSVDLCFRAPDLGHQVRHSGGRVVPRFRVMKTTSVLHVHVTLVREFLAGPLRGQKGYFGRCVELAG